MKAKNAKKWFGLIIVFHKDFVVFLPINLGFITLWTPLKIFSREGPCLHNLSLGLKISLVPNYEIFGEYFHGYKWMFIHISLRKHLSGIRERWYYGGVAKCCKKMTNYFHGFIQGILYGRTFRCLIHICNIPLCQ